MLALPHGAADTAGIAWLPPICTTGWPGRNGARCAATRDRPHARAAAAVRNRKRLVQVQVTDVGADRRRARQPDLRVHVRAVHVHLAAVLVHDARRCPGCFLEHAVRRRIRHHQRSQAIAMLLGLRPQVVDVDVAVAVGRTTTTTCMPAIDALAGLVPCADAGMSTTSRAASPRSR